MGIEIIIRNLSFIVIVHDNRFKKMISNFKVNFYTFSKIPDHRNKGKMKNILDKIYTGGNEINDEFIFNISTFETFLQHIKYHGLSKNDIKMVDMRRDDFEKVNIKMDTEKKSRVDQKRFIKAICKKKGIQTRLVDLQMGKGKFLSNDTLIKIPNLIIGESWKSIGSLVIGDKVIGRDGLPTNVIGVYPQGVKPIYKITFSDGRKSMAGGEHLWEVISPTWNDRNVKKKGISPNVSKVLNTLEIKDLIDKNNRLYIPLCESEKSKDIPLPMDPYLVGYVLGNGSITSGSLDITTSDTWVTKEISEIISDDYRIKHSGKYKFSIVKKENSKKRNKYVTILKELFIPGKHGYKKNIPRIYFNGSTRQRLDLLQGLMDSGGIMGKEGHASYSTSSHELCDDVRLLVRSLGGMASVSVKKSTYTYKGEKLKDRLNYNIGIRIKDINSIFRLPRKKNLTSVENQYTKYLKLGIKSVEYVYDAKATCIAVDNADKLYVSEDFIVTHNTFIAASSFVKIKNRVGILVLPKYIEKWIGDLKELTNATDDDILIISGGDSLRKLLDMKDNDEVIPNYIIFSNRTFSNYVKEYESLVIESLFTYSVKPMDVCEYLNIGTIIVDEVHQEFYSVFKNLLYLDPEYFIGLSATLITQDKRLNKMYDILFPKESRLSFLAYDMYINVYSISYTMSRMTGIRYDTNRGYNHIMFEQSLIRNSILLESYIKMIKYYTDKEYISRKKDGQKLIIFAATIEFCTILTNEFKYFYPKLDVRRYIGDDPYENAIDADIRITTIKSAGTALDIPNLITTIMTTSIGSEQANLQALGRLRKIDGVDVRFIYLWCENIRPQVKYHYAKMEVFKNKVKNYYLDRYTGLVTT